LLLELPVSIIEQILALELSVPVIVLFLPKLPGLIVGRVLADEPVLFEGTLLPDRAIAVVGDRLPFLSPSL